MSISQKKIDPFDIINIIDRIKISKILKVVQLQTTLFAGFYFIGIVYVFSNLPISTFLNKVLIAVLSLAFLSSTVNSILCLISLRLFIPIEYFLKWLPQKKISEEFINIWNFYRFTTFLFFAIFPILFWVLASNILISIIATIISVVGFNFRAAINYRIFNSIIGTSSLIIDFKSWKKAQNAF